MSPFRLSANRRSGFALLTTIVLVAFLVLLLVGLATFIRVETQVADNTAAVAKARQNALLALNVAIGNLQQTAGPDARVTATADLLNASSPNRDWTGVWTVNTGTGALSAATPTRWLVSGNSAPAAASNDLVGDADAIRLVRAGASTGTDVYDRDIWVQQERIRSTGVPGFDSSDELTIGTFAYHVSDEGVKASISDQPSTAISHGYYTAADLAARARLLQMGGRAGRGFESITAYDQYSTANQNALAKVSNPYQQVYVDSTNLTTDAVRLRRPDYTYNSLGVLVNTATGSLKRDLSFDLATALGDISDEYTALMTAARANNATTGVVGTEIVAPVAGTVGLFHAAPVITQFNFQAAIFNGPGPNGVGGRDTNPNLETRARFFIELWNPYTESLIIPNGSSLRVLIRNLPTFSVQTRDPADGTKNYGTANVNIGTIYGNTTTAGEVALVFNPTDLLTLPDGRRALSPGRLYSGGHPSGYAANAAADVAKQTLTFGSVFRNTYWNRPSGALGGGAVPPDTAMQFRVSTSGPTTLELRLQIGSGTTWTDIGTYTLPEFTAASSPWTASQDRNPRVGYHVRASERSNEGADWLTALLDFRRSTYPDTYFNYAIDDEPQSYAGADIPAGNSAIELATIFSRNHNTNPQFAYDLALYELPRQELVSVGNLQHVAFNDGSSRSPSYALGNSWGDTRNGYFDRFFFSTVPSSTAAGVVTRDLPNRFLSRVPATSGGVTEDDDTVRGDPEEAARHVLVQNAFNINSTSVEAWKAVLGGLRLSAWPYVVRDVTGNGLPLSLATVNLNNPFFRFPQTAHELWNPTNATDYKKFYRQGTRSLSQEQVNALAEEIVDQIRTARASNGPFPSLRSFLAPQGASGNIFEEAILAADGRAITERANWDSALGLAIDPRSPSALTAADLMTALAPIATTRTDTFVVRAYGALTSPLDANASNTTGALPAAQAQAWLEATVQRLPETVNTTDDPVTPTGTFGRKFKVTSFRWLSPDDL